MNNPKCILSLILTFRMLWWLMLTFAFLTQSAKTYSQVAIKLKPCNCLVQLSNAIDTKQLKDLLVIPGLTVHRGPPLAPSLQGGSMSGPSRVTEAGDAWQPRIQQLALLGNVNIVEAKPVLLRLMNSCFFKYWITTEPPSKSYQQAGSMLGTFGY